MAELHELTNSTVVWVKTPAMPKGQVGSVVNNRDGGFINIRLYDKKDKNGDMYYKDVGFDPAHVTIIPRGVVFRFVEAGPRQTPITSVRQAAPTAWERIMQPDART